MIAIIAGSKKKDGAQSVTGKIIMQGVEMAVSRHIVTHEESHELWLRNLQSDMNKEVSHEKS